MACCDDIHPLTFLECHEFLGQVHIGYSEWEDFRKKGEQGKKQEEQPKDPLD